MLRNLNHYVVTMNGKWETARNARLGGVILVQEVNQLHSIIITRILTYVVT